MPDDAYEALGEHYMTAIMPAQVRKPKQKASAEGTVRDAAAWVMAQLRNEASATIEDARAAVLRCLDAYNAHPLQKCEGSRDSVFAEAEAAELRPLPDVRYDVYEWVYNRSVNLDFRVVYARNRYSVPHRYVGRKVDLRVGDSTLSIYHAGERIATHPLFPSCVRNAYSTDGSHMPEAFARPEWDDARIRSWARKVWPSCAEVVNRILARVKVKEQAHNPALSVLRLSKKYGDERLEAACAHTLPGLTSPRYQHLKAILESSLVEGRRTARPCAAAPGHRAACAGPTTTGAGVIAVIDEETRRKLREMNVFDSLQVGDLST